MGDIFQNANMKLENGRLKIKCPRCNEDHTYDMEFSGGEVVDCSCGERFEVFFP